MKRFLILSSCLVAIVCICSVIQAVAQTADKILVKGRVTDSKDKLPVIGVTVIEQDQDKRTIVGTVTDIDGNFALKVSNVSNKLVISVLGYKSRTLDIGTRRDFSIPLESNAIDLAAVAVVATRTTNSTGLNIDVRDKTTSTVTISAKDLEELQATSIDQALQGRLPGVDIVSNSGDPGAGMSIRIRGTSSINGVTNPLIIVDGVPFETTVPTNFNFAAADQNQYADLLAIAPSDIKDISILKDAAATAVWGARAASGVLVITTKRGTIGPPNVSFTFKGSMTKQPSGVPLLTGNQYSTFIPEMVMNVTGAPLNPVNVKELAYNPLDVYYYNNYSQNTNWVDAITRTGHVYDNNLSISGGGEKARYFASLGYVNNGGTTLGTDLNRLNTRLNLDYTVSDKIQFTTFVSYSHSIKNDIPNDLRSIATIRAPNTSIYEYNDFGVLTPNFFSPAANINGQYPRTYNPVAMANSYLERTINDRITPHFNLKFKLSNTFSIVGDVVFDISNGKVNNFLPQIATGRPFTENTVNSSGAFDYDTYTTTTKTDFLYNPVLNDKHSFTGVLSLQTNDSKSVGQTLSTFNSASSTLTDPSSPALVNSLEASINQSRSVAALLNGQYKFLDRYLINVALRGEGSSKFGSDQRYGLFPSVSVRYRLSGEKFMQRYSSWLDDLSLRGGYGVSGGAPRDNYLFYGNYAGTNANYLGLAGVAPTNIQLNNLKWEKLQGLDAGVVFVMFKNRLNVDFGVYRNRTTDLLTPNLAIPTSTGYGSVSLNEGTLDNRGVELSIFSTPYKSKSLVVNFNFNVTNNINTLREISPYYPTQSGNITANGNYLSLLQVNNPLGSFYGYRYKGVYKDAAATVAKDVQGAPILSPNGTPVQMQFNYPFAGYTFQPGDAMYEDINHDGNINFQDVVYLGNGNPKFTGGFGPSITYKGNITLNAFFNYRIGGSIINQTKLLTTNQYSYNNQSTAVLHRWRTAGDDTDMPRALYNAGYNWLGSDRYVESSTFLRLSSITAKYDFNKAFVRRIGVKRLSMYVTGQNLLTLTRYTGQDPEVSTRGQGIFNIAKDDAATPPLRQFTLGISSSF